FSCSPRRSLRARSSLRWSRCRLTVRASPAMATPLASRVDAGGPSRMGSELAAERVRGVHLLQHLATSDGHVHAAGQARVEAAHGAHDVDALEAVRGVLLEDRSVLYRVLEGTRGAEGVPDTAVPRRRRVRVVVRDLPVPDDHVVAERAAYRLGEAAADGLLRQRERLPGPGVAAADLGQRLLRERQRQRRGVGLEVGTGAVALQRVAPLRDLPLEPLLRL